MATIYDHVQAARFQLRHGALIAQRCDRRPERKGLVPRSRLMPGPLPNLQPEAGGEGMKASSALSTPSTGMTFDEIAIREGISVSGVFFAYRSGLRKLRRSGSIAALAQLAGELQRNRYADHAVSRKVVKL